MLFRCCGVSVEGRLSFLGVDVGVFGSAVFDGDGELGLDDLRDEAAVARAYEGGAMVC